MSGHYRTPYDMFVEIALTTITCEREEDAQMWADRLEAVSELMSDKMIAKAQIEVGKRIGLL